jgi:hypothetical protein
MGIYKLNDLILSADTYPWGEAVKAFSEDFFPGDTCLYFSGSVSNTVEIPFSVFVAPGSSSFSVEFWVREHSNGAWMLPVEWASGDRFYVGSISPNGWNLMVTCSGVRYDTRTKSSLPCEEESWSFVQAAIDKSLAKMTLRKYSVANNTWGEVSVNINSTPTNPSGKLSLSSTGSYPFRGYLSEVRIWHKIRTQEDADADMYLRANQHDDGLVACYPLSEGVGDIALDVSAIGNDGVISGATWAESIS